MMELLAASIVSLLAGGAAGYALSANRRHPTCAASGTGIVPPGAWREDESSFCVATYNIHRGRGTDGRRDLRRIARVLRGVDIAGLQEVGCPLVGRRIVRPGAPDVQRVASMLDMGWLFMPGQTFWHRARYGNGMLSRIPIVDWYREPLIDSEGCKFRTLTEARTRIAGVECAILVTHISKRADQATQLRRVIDRFLMHKTAVLVGDFNATPSQPILRELIDSGFATDAIGESLGQADDPQRIDWVLTRGLRVIDCEVEPVGASDHPCYRVRVSVPTLASVSSRGTDADRSGAASLLAVE